MKALFWFGMVVLLLGIASLFVPIPQTQREGIKAGNLSVGVETHDSQKVSPIISAVPAVAVSPALFVASLTNRLSSSDWSYGGV